MAVAEQLDYTSERVNPAWYRGSPQEYLIYLFHVATYRFAERYTAGRTVLDYGCGTGYGTAMLATGASHVTGIDVDREVTDFAEQQYAASNLDFRHVQPAEDGPLPFDDETFETVVSFQVIEHVTDLDAYLTEIHRVLRPGGQFVVATPDRSTRLFPLQKPWNMHHVTEFSAVQLECLLGRYFDDQKMFGMTGDPDVLQLELRRTRRMKWLLLPLTLPLVPDAIRTRGLRLAKSAFESTRQRDSEANHEFGFDETAISIGAHQAGCVNLVGVAYKGSTASNCVTPER